MQKVTLIRGVPGSGKSTLAKAMVQPDTVHLEADMFFVNDAGVYKYDPSSIKAAHAWCQDQAREALAKGLSVVVSNTFVKVWELQPYLDMAKAASAQVTVLVATGHWPNCHGVPQTIVDRMRNQFQPFKGEKACS